MKNERKYLRFFRRTNRQFKTETPIKKVIRKASLQKSRS